jgi:serine/threonine protein kinase
MGAEKNQSSFVDRADGPLPTVARYRILAQLGTGGMAHVYLAVMHGDRGFNKLLVLKIPRDTVTSDPTLLAMFMDEARLAARLNHPNVVQTYEVVSEGGRDIIVMEYLDGYTLHEVQVRARRAGKTVPTWMHLQVLSHALTGLHYAHEAKNFDGKPLELVHRDVSPHNIFITFDGQVKVLDFGIAKAATSTHETEAGTFKGKVRYMPYEQLACEPIDRRADIYAMGSIIWEAAVGDRLWKGMSDVEVIRHVLDDKVPMPSDVKPDVIPELDAICRKAMARNKEERYATCLELQNDVDAYLATLSSHPSRRVIEFMEELFAEDRAERQKLIERQLARAAILTSGEFDLPSGQTPASAGLPLIGAALAQGSGTDSASGARPANGSSTSTTDSVTASTRQPHRRPLWLLLLAVFGIGGLILVMRLGKTPAPAGTAAGPPSTAASAEPQLLSIRLGADPPGARLFFDDALLADNPHAMSAKKDGSKHILRGEAPGYVTKRVEVTLDEDKTITLTLDKEEPQAAASTHSAAATPRPTTPAGTGVKPRGTASAGAGPASAERPADGPPGFLSLDTYPWTRVSEGGRVLGQTPLVHVSLPAGEHTLVLENPDQNLKQTLTVTIKSGETYSRRLAFK